jgi:hypothetical protein
LEGTQPVFTLEVSEWWVMAWRVKYCQPFGACFLASKVLKKCGCPRSVPG